MELLLSNSRRKPLNTVLACEGCGVIIINLNLEPQLRLQLVGGIIDRLLSFDNRLMTLRPLQVSRCLPAGKQEILPISGTASDVEGIFSATKLRNTVNERSMVTPVMKISDFILNISVFLFFVENIYDRVFSYNATGNVRVPSF